MARWWLKPGQRAVIEPCSAQLVKLDESGQPVPGQPSNPYYHVFPVKAGRYTISADMELGSGLSGKDPKIGPQEQRFAAKGEWVGSLRTGAVEISLFGQRSR